ncbi:MAG: cation-transporting P-type ATPase [Clostridia bacterium]|nr:cation-transporting P-type ATPase [Clostridia bacterium]
MGEKWYHLTVDQTVSRLKTDLNTGLSDKNAADRLRREGLNTVFDIPRKQLLSLIKDVARDPTVFMLICMVILGAIFDQPVSAGIITGIIIINWVFVTLLYIKAERRFRATSEKFLHNATVLRSGKPHLIKSNRVCRGDILLLSKGDVVPADSRVAQSNGLTVSEEKLTGDKTVKKKITDPVFSNNLSVEMQENMIFAGSVVHSGTAKAIVCRIAQNNEAAVKGHAFVNFENERFRGLRKLKRYSSVWSIVSLILIFILVGFEFAVGFGNMDLFTVFCTTLALCASGMCEVYTVFGYIVTAKGLYGLSFTDKAEEASADIRYSAKIEDVSKITTLIVPKDGALVAGSVKLEKLWCDNTLMSSAEKRLEKICRELVSCALDSTVYAQNDYEKAFNRFKAKNCSAQEQVILDFAIKLGIFDLGYTASHTMLEHREELLQGNVSKSLITDGKQNRIIMRGGVEDILPLCCDYRNHERVKSIKNDKINIKEEANRVAKQGYTVVCVASKYTEAKTIGQTHKDRDYVFEGFLAISEPRLYQAEVSVALMKNHGINVIMLCDEADKANRSYAKSINIISNDDEIITGSDFKRVSELNFEINAGKFKYYEALDPIQKRRLITLLKKSGETVGYFGSGFDDISALEEADISFSAVSVAGEEIQSGNSKEAVKLHSDVVVTSANKKQGGFNAMSAMVLNVKSVICNLNSMVKYLVCAQSARIVAVFGALILGVIGLGNFSISPMLPVQLLTLGMLADFCAVLAFSVSRAQNELDTMLFYKKAVIVNLKSAILGLWWAVIALVLPVFAYVFGFVPTAHQSSTMVFYGFLLASPVVTAEMICKGSLFKDFSKLNRFIGYQAGISVLVILLTALIKPIGRLFDVAVLGTSHWVLCAVLPFAVFAVFEISKTAFIKESDALKEEIKNEDEKI